VIPATLYDIAHRCLCLLQPPSSVGATAASYQSVGQPSLCRSLLSSSGSAAKRLPVCKAYWRRTQLSPPYLKAKFHLGIGPEKVAFIGIKHPAAAGLDRPEQGRGGARRMVLDCR